MRGKLWVFLPLCVLGLNNCLGPQALADRILLRGGGTIKGTVRKDPQQPDILRIQTYNSERLLEIPRDKVLSITAERDPLDDYDAKAPLILHTAQAQYDFGIWCEENGLPGPAQIHFQEAVRLDPSFGPARKKLGHVEHNGVWMTYDQRQAALGLIQHQGKWISPTEKEKLADRTQKRKETEAWVRQLRTLRQLIDSPTTSDRENAQTKLLEIRDPSAVPALLEVFNDDNLSHRTLLLSLLAAIPSPEATAAVLTLYLSEPDETLRLHALDDLVTRQADPELIPQLTRLLSSSNPGKVGRAALALARLNARGEVPKLIAALTRAEHRWILVPSIGRAVGPGAPAPGFLSMAGQAYVPSVSPVVGPGVVAFQPNVATIGSGSYLGAGPTSAPTPGPPLPRLVTIQQPNPDVLQALRQLTQQDFGFDENAWRLWASRSFRAEEQPARRVPNP